MKVKHMIEKLLRENQEEEVVFILDDDRSHYYIIESKPFLHAGPHPFLDKKKQPIISSVVVVRSKKIS
jgi:hypothetical protein